MSLKHFLLILAARRGIILVAVLGCFLASMIVAQLLPPRYKATTRIVLDIVKPDPVTGQVIASNFLRAYTQTQIELIEDYRTAGRVVDELGWANDPAIIARFNASSEAATGDIRRWLAQGIIANTKADLVEGSNLLEISYTDSSAEGAKRTADLVRRSFMEQSLEFQRESAAKTADWFEKQTVVARQALTDSEAARTAYAKANGIVVTPNNVDLETERLSQLSSQASGGVSGGGGGGGASPTTTQLDLLDQQIAQTATQLGPNHPALQAMQRQRSVLAAAAARERPASGPMSFGPSPGMVAAQKSRVIADRDKIDKLDQLQRDVDLKKDQYLKSAARSADLRLQANSADAGMTPLGDAAAPEKPFFPNIPLIVAGSTLLGLALGLCCALLIELLARRVRSGGDLEHAAGAPVFATIRAEPAREPFWRRLFGWPARHDATGVEA
ncbi:MAG: exopolysaccharide biosynthesis protein EpsF [Sphingomonadaceae bacterium]|nr:exopolysaccharide biosynthesis protein EpsF [Sphingomonadaceae bacterium]